MQLIRVNSVLFSQDGVEHSKKILKMSKILSCKELRKYPLTHTQKNENYKYYQTFHGVHLFD